jgi:L-asparaginase
MAPAGSGGGVVPSLDAADLVRSAPQISRLARITSHSIRNAPSPSITIPDLLAALDFARKAVDDGAQGVVLTHGTDTLEESAYFLDLLWDRPNPLIVTGAMRSPDEPGADGPANLLDAVVTAISPDAQDLGVLVVLDDEAHLARLVTKTNTTALQTFQSPGWGPLGHIIEDQFRCAFAPAHRYPALPAPGPDPIRIPIIETPLGDDGMLLQAATRLAPRAIVIAGVGGGHVPGPVADICEQAVRDGIPVILSSRTGSGSTLAKTYGYPGGDVDLIARGLTPSGFLSPRKARLLAHVVLAAGGALKTEFANRG